MSERRRAIHRRLLIRLRRDGHDYPIDRIAKAGVILNGETGALPRRFQLQFGIPSRTSTRGKISSAMISAARSKMRWPEKEIHLEWSRDPSGRLAVCGIPSEAFPPTYYWCRLSIGELDVKSRHRSFKLPESGDKELTFDVEEKDGRIALTSDPAGVDDTHIPRVIRARDSKVDGSPLRVWINDDARRARRRACLLNILAKLRATPTVDKPLIRHVRHIFLADVDRVYAAVQRGFIDELRTLATAPGANGRFFPETNIHASVHELLVDRARRLDAVPRKYHLRDFRENKMPGLQAVVAVPMKPEWDEEVDPNPGRELEDTEGSHYVDLDIDLGVPTRDLVGFFVHLGEVAMPGKTDHLKLRKKLASDARLRPFLYYRNV